MKSNPNSPTPPFWENQGQPIGVAHRGGDGAGIEKENSLAAFQAAYDSGFRWFETDVVPTKDNQLLAIHGRGWQLHPNKDLPSRAKVQRLTLEEVKQMVVGGESIALLEDLLTTFPDVKWFIDPKTGSSVAPLIDILKQQGRNLDHISVGAFSQARTTAVSQEVKEATRKDICTSIGPLGAFAILGASETDLAKLESRDRLVYGFLKSMRKLPSAEDAVASTGATSLNAPFRWINESRNLVELAHGLGLHVASWTPNEEGSIRQSAQTGADAIMSDRLEPLQRVLKEESR